MQGGTLTLTMPRRLMTMPSAIIGGYPFRTKGYMAHFGVQEYLNILKRVAEKKKTVVFRKRISAKTTVFSVFKSVNLVGKSDDTKT